MHDLALCTVHVGGDVIVDGFVVALAGDVLTIAASHVVPGLAPGDDVTVLVLDEVRGECLYAGFVSRVAGDRLDVADLELISRLQKRAVVRIRVTLPCRGTLGPDGAAFPRGDIACATSSAIARQIDFTMLDVSAHGMRVSTNADLAVGSVIRFRFEELDHPFTIDAVVARGEESRTGMRYGCRFTGMTVRQGDALFSYVLRTQGHQRRARLGV